MIDETRCQQTLGDIISEKTKRRMHENSMEAWRTLDRAGRRAAVLKVYRDRIQPLTDREVMEILGFTDPNAVRPRCTELLKDGLLTEVGKVKDSQTNKPVRVCTNVTR